MRLRYMEIRIPMTDGTTEDVHIQLRVTKSNIMIVRRAVLRLAKKLERETKRRPLQVAAEVAEGVAPLLRYID